VKSGAEEEEMKWEGKGGIDEQEEGEQEEEEEKM
jgi:hypothetical protein